MKRWFHFWWHSGEVLAEVQIRVWRVQIAVMFWKRVPFTKRTKP